MEHTSRSTYCSKRWPHSSKRAKTPESSERRKGPSSKWHERFINRLMSCGCCMCMGCMMWIVALVAVCSIGMVSVWIKVFMADNGWLWINLFFGMINFHNQICILPMTTITMTRRMIWLLWDVSLAMNNSWLTMNSVKLTNQIECCN